MCCKFLYSSLILVCTYKIYARAYYAGIILRIIGYKFGENNAEIIGCLI